MAFGISFESTDIGIFFTLVLLEGVLSFDNAAVLAAMVRRLPHEDRRKALLYGIGGAYVLRTLVVLGVAVIIANPAIKVVGGLYLLYLAGKHFLTRDPHASAKPSGLFGLSGFWGVVLAVEIADLAFALDQVLVAVAMTDRIVIIILAAFMAIFLLRISASYMTRVMDWFPALESLAYGAVGFVGLKLIAVEAAHYAGYVDFEVPKEISMAVTLTLLVVPPLTKLVLEKMHARAGVDTP